jgi:hypothetical protein
MKGAKVKITLYKCYHGWYAHIDTLQKDANESGNRYLPYAPLPFDRDISEKTVIKYIKVNNPNDEIIVGKELPPDIPRTTILLSKPKKTWFIKYRDDKENRIKYEFDSNRDDLTTILDFLKATQPLSNVIFE